MFEISATGAVTLQPTKVNEIQSTPDNPFPQIRGYDQRILITQPEKLAPYSVLQIVSETHETIQQLKTISETQGAGDILTGIGKAFGAALEAVTGSGNTIIRSIGSAFKDSLDGVGDLDQKIVYSLGTATSQVISATGDAVKDIEEGAGTLIKRALGGNSGIVTMSVVVLIIIYLLLNKPDLRFPMPCLQCRQETHDLDMEEIVPKRTPIVRNPGRIPRSSPRRRKHDADEIIHIDEPLTDVKKDRPLVKRADIRTLDPLGGSSQVMRQPIETKALVTPARHITLNR